jgi:hypothetical protein
MALCRAFVTASTPGILMPLSAGVEPHLMHLDVDSRAKVRASGSEALCLVSAAALGFSF